MCPPQSSLFHFPTFPFVSCLNVRTLQQSVARTFVGVGAACRDAEQVLRSAGPRCGNKQTYRFNVREPRRSGLRPFVIMHFNTILLTFGGWLRQMGMSPRTVLLLRRSLSAQSVRLMAVAHCGSRLCNQFTECMARAHTHTHTHTHTHNLWEADSFSLSQEISGV